MGLQKDNSSYFKHRKIENMLLSEDSLLTRFPMRKSPALSHAQFLICLLDGARTAATWRLLVLPLGKIVIFLSEKISCVILMVEME